MPQTPTQTAPRAVLLHLARAAVQTLADQAHIDLLHIKGNAVSPLVRPEPLPGSDIDVLVRPAHVARLHAAVTAHGWTLYSSFRYGSPFEHAQTYRHPLWGFLDAHRLFPGVELDPAAAFDRFWARRDTIDVSGVTAAVPDTVAQAVILILNDARNRRTGDVERLWTHADAAHRAAIEAEVTALHASVGFAAATGTLDAHRGERTHRLWHVITHGGSRAAEWRARVHAAPTLTARLALIARAPLVNTEHLAHTLGRTPRRRDIIRAFLQRPALALRQWTRRRRP